jgi:hypothetical protein
MHAATVSLNENKIEDEYLLKLRRILNDLRTNIDFSKFENTNFLQELRALI